MRVSRQNRIRGAPILREKIKDISIAKHRPTMKETAKVRISILYPNKQGSRCDFKYYIEKHMPTSINLLSAQPGFKGVSVERGVGGGAPGAAPTFVATCHYLFDSVESFMAAFAHNAEALQRDMLNYTDIEPIIQVSEVLIS